MKTINFKEEKVNNKNLLVEDLLENEKIKIMCEKLVICGGALTLAHGVLSADTPFFCAGLIIETAAITALQCSKLKTDRLNNNKKTLLRTMYHNK